MISTLVDMIAILLTACSLLINGWTSRQLSESLAILALCGSVNGASAVGVCLIPINETLSKVHLENQSSFFVFFLSDKVCCVTP